MFNIHLINDCCDSDARIRQEARYGAYFPGRQIKFAGVDSDIEAAFLLVDVLDALDGNRGVIAINVAPRNGTAKKYANGTPFGVILCGNTLIIASVAGNTLQLLNKVKPGLELRIFDISEVVPYLTDDKSLQERIIQTQFRSLEFVPRLVRAMLEGKELPSSTIALADHCERKEMAIVAFIDCFGNLKTTLLPEEVGFEVGAEVDIQLNNSVIYTNIRCYARLKDIPDGELGVTIGSSGLGQHRFLELMCQGGSASRLLDAKVGTKIRLIK